MTETLQLKRPEGTVAYDVTGDGPLVVCVPGMGDLRQTYRFLAPALVAAGYRVATTDLRGHGDSDSTFTSYGDEETAGDITALIEELGGPAVVVGNSMAAGSAILVAAARPELVGALVLLGPFARDPKVNVVLRLLMRAAMGGPWAVAAWTSYLPSLYAGQKPADFAEYRTQVAAALRRPGHAKAFAATTRLTHAPVEKALPGVHTPALVVMGDADPDFPDPRAEAAWLAGALNGESVIVPESGHYPQSQRPDVVSPAVVAFLGRVIAGA